MNGLKFGLLAFVLLSSTVVSEVFALTAPRSGGTINIDSGVNGKETLEIGIVSLQSDRIAFFPSNESHRFELISSSQIVSGQNNRFEFDHFGYYGCYGQAYVDSVEFGNVIALAGVKPPLLKIHLTFAGTCRVQADGLYKQINGTLEFTEDQVDSTCLDYKNIIDNLNLEMEGLTTKITDLIAERDAALKLADKLADDKRAIKRLHSKTNPKNLPSLKSFYTQLTRILAGVR